MVNQELVKLLQEIADLKEVLGENRFKVVAYQRAAQNLSYVSEDLTDIYRQKGLKGLEEIEGVGKAIAHHIEEYIKTGKVKEWHDLRKRVAPAVLELMDIPGVGPKTAKKLVDVLRIKNINELQSFLKEAVKLKVKNQKLVTNKLSHERSESGAESEARKVQSKIQKLETTGLKEKSFENILRGIEVLKGQEGRLPLVKAAPVVEEITDYMKKASGLERFDAVGSYRRQRETVGDIDIVASLQTQNLKFKIQNAIEVIDKFTSAPFAKEVINKGSTKARIIHTSGVQIDLEILPKEKYGSLLQHFTGSKEHNVALRTWGVEHGFSISEHGIKKIKSPASRQGGQKLNVKNNKKEKLILCETEEKVYQTLGMEWIPPELRENRGEIEAALRHKLPKLIESKDIKGDLQVHTNWSDGHNTIYEMAKAAQDLGHQYLALTDHSVGLGVARGLDQKRFTERHKEIVAAQKKLKIRILEGVEVNIRASGHLDLPDEVFRKLDYVLAAVHSSFSQDKATMTRRIIGAIEHPLVHAIAHPTGRLIERRPSYDVDWVAVFKAAAKRRKALEIDSFPDRLDLPDYYVFEAKKLGVKFVIGTDSHSVEHLPFMRFGVSVARRGWLTKQDVLNTMGVHDLLSWFKK